MAWKRDTQGGQGGVALSLSGKVALVTGGSRGIGAATVRLLREAGAQVVFSYNTAADRAEALVAESGGPERCRGLQQELASAEQGRALVEAAVAVWSKLDILVVNHGVWPPHEQPISTMPTAQWRNTLGVNLDSVFGLVSAAAGHMIAQSARKTSASAERAASPSGVRVLQHGVTSDRVHAGVGRGFREANDLDAAAVASGETRGHIVLVASTAAQRGEAFHADYAASKGALLALTKSLSSELAPEGILCNCVAPGWVRTEMSAGTLDDPHTSKKALGLIPLGRAAEPEEIAGPIVFLCTPWAGFISGEVWNVNGGAVLVG